VPAQILLGERGDLVLDLGFGGGVWRRVFCQRFGLLEEDNALYDFGGSYEGSSTNRSGPIYPKTWHAGCSRAFRPRCDALVLQRDEAASDRSHAWESMKCHSA
jgi:hypothetical protein